jgi:hypothetical protein
VKENSGSRRLLLGLHVFNGLTAIGGGLALMTGWIPDVESWTEHTGFPGTYFPGVILFAVVGGSALVAAVAGAKRVPGWELASIVAGTVMVAWILGEVASIRGFHVLQVIYLGTGLLALWLTPSTRRVLDPIYASSIYSPGANQATEESRRPAPGRLGGDPDPAPGDHLGLR